MFSLGSMQVLYVSDPNVVKEITTTTSQDFGKPTYQQKTFGPLLGQGILSSNGAIWARQRKIMAPELFMDKVRVSKIEKTPTFLSQFVTLNYYGIYGR